MEEKEKSTVTAEVSGKPKKKYHRAYAGKKYSTDQPFQLWFKSHPEINVGAFAQRVGIHHTMLRNYLNGFKRPSAERLELIREKLHEMGQEFASADF